MVKRAVGFALMSCAETQQLFAARRETRKYFFMKSLEILKVQR